MINIELFPSDKRRVTYLLLPMELPGLPQLAESNATSIVAVSGLDWDDDLTPWPAPGVFRNDPDFKGQASRFIELLETRVIPMAEEKLELEAGFERNLCGISLSGLFALWAWMQDDAFRNIAGISSSFWYDGFVDWLDRSKIPAKPGKAYFSLGNKEGGPRDNRRFQTVKEDTARVVEILRRAGINVTFEQTEGTHYSPPMPRLEKALAALRESR